MATVPEAPQPSRKQGYTYGLDGFTVNKIHRADPARLRYLLLPQLTQGVRAKKAAEEEAKRIIKKPWTVAQLHHYGIKTNSKVTADGARDLLSRSVAGGLKQSNEHRVFESTRVAREFNALDTPTAQAQYSIDMFLRRYFLDENGKPEQSKTREPVALPGFDNRAQMHAAVEPIPGLVSESGGDGRERTVVVGWRDTGVGRVAGQIKREQRSMQEHTAKAAWDQLRRKHEDFAKLSKTPDANETFSFSNAWGQYIIKCEAADDYNDLDQTSKLRLRITKGKDGWYGIFDFGILSGIMLLGKSPEDVTFRVHQQQVGPRSDERDSESDEESDEHDIPTKKRNAPPKRSEAQPSKRLKKSASPGGVIYLQWRGQETGEKVIQVDPSNKNIGKLVFSDNTGMTFHGTASMSFLGSKVRFQGYKISGLGGPVTRSWDQYSKAAYERARVARWR
ncbi:MAG: hypothetical protein Q9212_001642 [Teloschistes hypoglaucus]